MNGIEKITGQIDADVQKEIGAALDQARAQAKEIEARYESQAEAQAEAIRRKGEQDAALRRERLVDLALKTLLELPDQEYIALLAKLAVAASRTGREQVILSQKDRSRYGKQAVTMANDMLAKKAGPRAAESAGMLTLAGESRPMAGGLILRDGRVETNCSFEVLIHLQRDALSAEVARALFA